ncbi:hypothetical protein C0J50_22440 [Silurus asotus]|uniref:Uncharacterized protein n=1 Tax=Silurus asotus TaxID=30991 RepID=A0AAD5AKK6_SILAS|nr:hypothetical protein C0J50_22440 [Silurus asotus]
MAHSKRFAAIPMSKDFQKKVLMQDLDLEPDTASEKVTHLLRRL